MMARNDVDVRVGQGFRLNLIVADVEAVPDQMMWVERLEIGRNLFRPRVRAIKLVARLPGEDGFVVFVELAGISISPVDDVLNGLFEVRDDAWVCPEGFR